MTASPLLAITTGIVAVALFTASADLPVAATITSGFPWTKSDARRESRSSFPSAYRYSMIMVRPAHAVAHAQLHQAKAHGRWGRETQHVGALGGEHRARVGIRARDAECAGQRGDPLLLQVAHRGQLEAVRVRKQAGRVTSPAPPGQPTSTARYLAFTAAFYCTSRSDPFTPLWPDGIR